MVEGKRPTSSVAKAEEWAPAVVELKVQVPAVAELKVQVPAVVMAAGEKGYC